jgi:hypothetical protein
VLQISFEFTEVSGKSHSLDGGANGVAHGATDQRNGRRSGLASSFLQYFERRKYTTTHLHREFSPFYPLTGRGDKELQLDDVMTVGQAEAIERKHLSPDSSAKTISEWLKSNLGGIQLPQEGILRILTHDITDLIEVIRFSLQDIEERSINMSPIHLQEHALHWRPLLGRFQVLC